MSLVAVSQQNPNDEDITECVDWQLPLSFVKKRHTEKIEGVNAITQTWRMKERVCIKTSACNNFKNVSNKDLFYVNIKHAFI